VVALEVAQDWVPAQDINNDMGEFLFPTTKLLI